jgi:hypothetical protein
MVTPSPPSSSIAPARSSSPCAATMPARTRWRTRVARPSPRAAFVLRPLPRHGGQDRPGGVGVAGRRPGLRADDRRRL